MDPKNTRLSQNNLSQEVHAGVCSLAQVEATETIELVVEERNYENVTLFSTGILE